MTLWRTPWGTASDPVLLEWHADRKCDQVPNRFLIKGDLVCRRFWPNCRDRSWAHTQSTYSRKKHRLPRNIREFRDHCFHLHYSANFHLYTPPWNIFSPPPQPPPSPPNCRDNCWVNVHFWAVYRIEKDLSRISWYIQRLCAALRPDQNHLLHQHSFIHSGYFYSASSSPLLL